MVVDEGEFIPEKFWQKNIAPVASQSKTTLVAISTVTTNISFFKKLMETKDVNGNFVFNSEAWTPICEECRKGPRPLWCPHKIHKMSDGKSMDKISKLAAFYTGDVSTMLQELFGVATSSDSTFFTEEEIHNIIHGVPISINARPPCIYLAIDPGGGGPGELSAVAMVEVAGKFVVKKTLFIFF